MSNPSLISIEQKIDALIAHCELLETERDELRLERDQWQIERARLIEKNEQARSRVEAMITHLKNLTADTE